ncbi:hypothetical protein TEA_002659 [Camellia sinensis var. sinensis]|uniref:Uncharacterized protein n=1 Tax=Camellia sinensis var. sinensis TaxID=542762 RepID=A0A4S4F1H1_CAMSN|nr:hypothetical protein TEA_002659 [Camellia sinensis var. sinensis]
MLSRWRITPESNFSLWNRWSENRFGNLIGNRLRFLFTLEISVLAFCSYMRNRGSGNVSNNIEVRESSSFRQRRIDGVTLILSALEAWGEACGFIAWTKDYMVSGGESVYQQLCSEITVEFNECSKQVLEMESLFLSPDCFRDDLAHLVRSIQVQEKQKLQLTATIQVLKKAGRPSERLVSHENCGFKRPMQHECVHVHEITEAAGTEEAEADAEYDNALKEAIRGVQDAVTTINEHLEEVRYEIAALEAE